MADFKSIIDAIRTKQYATAQESVSQVLQQKMTERLAIERKALAESVLKEDRGLITTAKDGGVNLTVQGSDGKFWKFWYATRDSAMEYVKSANIQLPKNQLSEDIKVNGLTAFRYTYSRGGQKFSGVRFYKDDKAAQADIPVMLKREYQDAKLISIKKTNDLRNNVMESADKRDAGKKCQDCGKTNQKLNSDGVCSRCVIERAKEDGLHEDHFVAKRKLECLECGKVFSAANPSAATECPKCGGSDIDLAEQRLAEDSLPMHDIQRVFDECGDIGETELLCGIRRLKVNDHGQVVGFVAEAIENANSSGQGHDPDHAKNPFHSLITSNGFRYSHSTPIRLSSGATRIHHTYEKGERRIGAEYIEALRKWQWTGSSSTSSGRQSNGWTAQDLQKYLKGATSRDVAGGPKHTCHIPGYSGHGCPACK